MYREEEPLLKRGAEDFCTDTDTFQVLMTRNQDDDKDSDQWCASIESEESCSEARHAITGEYFLNF